MTQSVQEDTSTVQQGVERVQETAQQTAEQVREQASQVREQAGRQLRGQLDSRSTEYAGQLRSAADAMRRSGEQLRTEGNAGPARITDAVAERAERLGTYLEQADADRMLRDVEAFARRQPWLVAVGGFALGLLGSRFVKASSARRYEGAGAPYSGPGAYGTGRAAGAVDGGVAPRIGGEWSGTPVR
jgi:hypothetical protein